MRPLRYSINVTLDGCGDHRAIIPDEDLRRYAAENLARADALLFGRVTYELMAAAWRAPARTGARPEWMQPWMEPFARTIDAATLFAGLSKHVDLKLVSRLELGSGAEQEIKAHMPGSPVRMQATRGDMQTYQGTATAVFFGSVSRPIFLCCLDDFDLDTAKYQVKLFDGRNWEAVQEARLRANSQRT